MRLSEFIGKDQLKALAAARYGEEKNFYINRMNWIKNTIEAMPKTYDTYGTPSDELICWLHYFTPNSDYWIVEKDSETEQLQAFGYVCSNGWKDCAELGYINIEELLLSGGELDLYFNPQPLKNIRKELQK